MVHYEFFGQPEQSGFGVEFRDSMGTDKGAFHFSAGVTAKVAAAFAVRCASLIDEIERTFTMERERAQRPAKQPTPAQQQQAKAADKPLTFTVIIFEWEKRRAILSLTAARATIEQAKAQFERSKVAGEMRPSERAMTVADYVMQLEAVSKMLAAVEQAR